MEESFFDKARTIRELADFLGTTELFIRNAIWCGHLKAYQLGPKCIRLLPPDMREWMAKCVTQRREHMRVVQLDAERRANREAEVKEPVSA